MDGVVTVSATPSIGFPAESVTTPTTRPWPTARSRAASTRPASTARFGRIFHVFIVLPSPRACRARSLATGSLVSRSGLLPAPGPGHSLEDLAHHRIPSHGHDVQTPGATGNRRG